MWWTGINNNHNSNNTRIIHTTAPVAVKAFPEVETDKKITHSPTTVAEREMIRKTEKNTHSDMDEVRPQSSE